ncbi:MAG: hypothetical protein GY714_05420 [Desulfobacterales bacterium]|nr:hypothetical protein [Desulfobacterales bacterium]
MRLISTIFILFVFGGLIWPTYVSAENDTIVFKLGTLNKHNPPYHYGIEPYTGKKESPGITIEMWSLVEKRLNELIYPRKFKIKNTV